MRFKNEIAVVAVVIGWILFFVTAASAALLGVQSAVPQITFNTGTTTPATSYDPATGILTVTASPVAYRWSTLSPVVVATPKNLAIRVHLDSTGKLVPNVEGDGIVVTGNVVAEGNTYSGTLLTGVITAFGFFNSSSTTDSFDFRFTTTGGALQALYAGSDIGVTLASESSNFSGSFTTRFQGKAKGTVGTTPGPYLSLSSTCSDANGEGQPIGFSATLTNTGTEALSAVNCSSTPTAALSGVPDNLPVGVAATITGSYLPVASPSPLSLSCSGTGSGSQVTITANSSATCNIVTSPALDLIQTCVDASEPGQAIAVAAALKNSGNETLTGFICSDSRGLTLFGIPHTLAPGDAATVTASYVPIASGSSDSISCSASGAIDKILVSAASSATCNIATIPGLAVSESCKNASAPGEAIAVTATVTNTGNEPLTGISCTSSRGATLGAVPSPLAPGSSATIKGSYVPSNSGSVDVITCSAKGAINSAQLSANGSATCDIVTNPQLSVAAKCSDAPAPGLPITISGTVTNTGNEPLTGLTCTDSKGGAIPGIPTTLVPGASAPLAASYVPSSSPSTDTLTCSAIGTISGVQLSKSSSSTCSTLNPAIRIRKYTNGYDVPTGTGPTLPFGSTVTWTYVVTNTGNTTLTNVTVTDNKVAGVFCPSSILAPGASMTCSATGTAIAGQYENVGKAVGSSGSATVSSTYPSHYVGNTKLGCTSTIGYWKNHAEKWPVTTLTLGTVRYSQAQLLAILQDSVTGNGLLTLAHQLIGAKLNLASGTSLTPTVQKYIAIGDSMIGALVVPPIGTGYLPPSATSGTEMVLDSYNNGVAVNGPGHCD